LTELALGILLSMGGIGADPMDLFQKRMLVLAMLSTLVCYLLSAVIASLDSIKGAIEPTTARAALVGDRAASK
jgi:hypothetical protein